MLSRGLRTPSRSVATAIILGLTAGFFTALPAEAAVTNVSATGISASVCNQSGSNLGTNAGDVTAERISGGDCLIKFITASTSYSWNVPYNISSISLVVVGAGGGGGGGGYSNQGSGGGGGGGGGGGQVTQATINGLIPSQAKSISVGSGGAGATYGGSGSSSWGGYHGRDGGSSSFATTTAAGGQAGFGGGIWGLSSPTSSTCNNSRPFLHDGLNIYYIDGIGGKGGNNGSATFAGALPYCSSDSSIGRGGAGGSGGGAGGNSATLSSATGTPPTAGVGVSINWTGTSVEYGTGGTGGTGGLANPASTVGAAGSRPGMGGAGGTGSRQNDNATTGALGGAGATGLVMIRYTPDTTAPSITSSSTFDVNENITTSTTAATIKTSESATISIAQSGDFADFTITFVDTVTASIIFIVTPNYESPDDSDRNNVYSLNINAIDVNGNSSSQAITIRVLDVNENPSVSAPVYKGISVTISISVGTVGKVGFFANGKKISNCLARPTSGANPNITATCSWKPTVQGRIAIKAVTTPTNGALPVETSDLTYIFVLKRTTIRG